MEIREWEMLFLIDYENVGNAGMKGCHYLNASDYIIIFYLILNKCSFTIQLDQVRAEAKKKEAENFKFRSYLKGNADESELDNLPIENEELLSDYFWK